jgi:murein DD-endopeptidase MepM/ murein hydrolase activator NlpD
MRFRLTLLLVLTLLTLLAVPSAAGGGAGRGALRLAPAPIRQGDAVFITLAEPAAQSASVRWRNQTYPLYKDGDVWRGMVPIRPEATPGGYSLVVTYRANGQEQRLERKVQVATVKYPVQHLKMARSTSKLYNYPGVEKEDRIIGTAIRTVSNRRLWEGDWMLPSPGRFSTMFGEKRIRNGRAVGRHRGLDIAAKKGVPVLAAADGKVALAGSYRKHGGTVVIDHGMGVTSLYLHLSAIHAKKGEMVKQGDLIGEVGSTGVATGPHLHWSVYVQGTPVEPLLFCRLSRRGVFL